MSTKPIVECVPNFSEGHDTKVIQTITDAIEKTNGIRLLNVEPDKDYNRVVVTFAGDPQPCVEAALAGMAAACETIDMRRHKGEHPRMGATDVVPFVPVSGVTMDDCAALANQFGERAARELNVPMYLYAHAARRPERKKLPDIRKGEYEGLQAKLADPMWVPDFGSADYTDRVARSGATVTGARFFLVAYNVNVETKDVQQADEIALRVRESGRPKKDAQGNTIKDEKGKVIRIPGTLRETQAKGIWLESFGITQVSMNLLNYLITGMHTAFEECKKEATHLGTRVTGSEIVGLIPKDAITMAGRFYSDKLKLQISSDDDLIACAVEQLGLNQLAPFDPKKKIIDFMLG